MAGIILILAVLSATTTNNVSVILIPVFVFFVLVIAKTQRTRTEINFADRTISRTWEIGFYTRRKVYSLDDFETVGIKDTGTVIEGYSLPVFNIQLTGRRKQIEIYSTDDPEEAKAVQLEITDFLKNSDLSTARRQ